MLVEILILLSTCTESLRPMLGIGPSRSVPICGQKSDSRLTDLDVPHRSQRVTVTDVRERSVFLFQFLTEAAKEFPAVFLAKLNIRERCPE
ncbi:hypothetical protein BDP27DRAFT_1309465 [Rhodocollybia butyracea]|uniref:Uncharacterized protein n=1 Tax=Rhodocollybia butyracea TaxID=206335 RepID=A0A9P5QBX8_9AGAR|nr:hypothetical protein BDP27DRAFT_1309465 [Rhodocollybia butyracea]